MKKILGGAMVLASLSMISCGNQVQEEPTVSHSGHHHEATEEYDGPIDPFCKMPVEDHWELYSIYQSDTVWFCAEKCKEVFDMNPEKYSVFLNN